MLYNLWIAPFRYRRMSRPGKSVWSRRSLSKSSRIIWMRMPSRRLRGSLCRLSVQGKYSALIMHSAFVDKSSTVHTLHETSMRHSLLWLGWIRKIFSDTPYASNYLGFFSHCPMCRYYLPLLGEPSRSRVFTLKAPIVQFKRGMCCHRWSKRLRLPKGIHVRRATRTLQRYEWVKGPGHCSLQDAFI